MLSTPRPRLLGPLFVALLMGGIAFGPATAAQATPLCRTVSEQPAEQSVTHHVCILKITRSAKYYWEYRAIVKIDDHKRPMGRYNCRTGDYVRRDGEHVSQDLGTQVICSFFK